MRGSDCDADHVTLVFHIHTWYLSIFLHGHIFLAQFFSTQKRVNCDKKLSSIAKKNWFYNTLMRQNTINCTHYFSTLQIFFTFLMWRAFSTWQSVMWRIFPHANLSCEEVSPHGRFFLHEHRSWCSWQISSMHDSAPDQGEVFPGQDKLSQVGERRSRVWSSLAVKYKF